MNKKTMNDFFGSFLTSDDEKITARFIRESFKSDNPAQNVTKGYYGTVAELTPLIEKRNEVWGAYIVVNHTGGIGTLDKDVQYARALFIDIDGATKPEFYPVEPSAILARSDGQGYHVYWFLSAPEMDLEKWTAAQKALIHFYKSDKTIHNPARLMRIPGTVNHKEKCDKPTYEIEALSGKRYTIAEVLTGHTGEDKRLEQARRRIANVFNGEELSDGEGRHKAFIQVSFILNDYGFTGETARAELSRANEKYLKSVYSPEELDKYLTDQKYAKNETGAVVVAKIQQDQAKIDRMREMLKDWYYVRHSDTFYLEGSDVPVTSIGFNNKFAYKADCANPVKFCFMNDLIKQYEGQVYDPAEGTDIPRLDGIVRNMYEAPTLEPIENTPDWFLSHMEYLIPDKKERDHFLAFVAYLLQNPGKKVMHGMLIIGKQGIGKSILQKVFEQLFGKSNVTAPHNENIAGSFTGWAKHCQIVIINELMQVDKKDFINKIKPFVTEPEIEIREMYKSPYHIKNCLNIIAFSNHDNAILTETDDRRWFIVKSPAVKKTPAYYDALIEAMDTRSGEVLHYLQNLDIADFRPGAAPPMTDAKKALIEYSKSDLDVWIEEGIESGAPPFDSDFVTIADIRDALPMGQRASATQNRVMKILRGLNAHAKDRVYVGRVQKRFWVIRNHDKYENFDIFTSEVHKIYGKPEEEKSEKKDEFMM